MSITTKIMSNNILLESILHLPELIEGRVCIFENGGYTLLYPSKFTTIEDGFNPMNYSILIHPKYNRCIVYSNKSERINYLVNKKYKELLVNKKLIDQFRIGDKIHIHSRKGIYEIVSFDENVMEITCNKWQYNDKKSIVISRKDFKCLAGGLHNYAQ